MTLIWTFNDNPLATKPTSHLTVPKLKLPSFSELGFARVLHEEDYQNLIMFSRL